MNTLEDQIPDYIGLIGLKMPLGDHVGAYFEELPDLFRLCEDFTNFYRLKKGKRTATKENLEPAYGTHYLVYSPYSEKYWYSFVNSHTNMNKLFQYFKDRNLYIFKKKAEASAESKEGEDYLLF